MKIIISENQLKVIQERFGGILVYGKYLGDNTIIKLYYSPMTKNWIIREYKDNEDGEIVFNKIISGKKKSDREVLKMVEDYAIERHPEHKLIKIN